MDESENTFPVDITDPSSRPWNFRPEGYLVVILAGTEEAERAEVHSLKAGSRIETSSSTPCGSRCRPWWPVRAPASRARHLPTGHRLGPEWCARRDQARRRASPRGRSRFRRIPRRRPVVGEAESPSAPACSRA